MDIPFMIEEWRPDEVAECIDGLSDSTYRKLWEITAELDRTGKAVPLGGDGSDGTVEYPPEPGSYPDGRLRAVWHRLTEAEQREIARCYEADYGEVRTE